MWDIQKLSVETSACRIHVLGPLQAFEATGVEPKMPSAARRLIALIAAAGPDGIDRDGLAHELWQDPLPESWKSALRNRMTAARKVLGADAILNDARRFRFSDDVGVDSWDLITHALDTFNENKNELSFLEGEPLVDIEPSPLTLSHITHVQDARAAMLERVVRNTGAMSPLALQTLRVYQRRHALEASITKETIRAHVLSGDRDHAVKIIADVKALSIGPRRSSLAWTDQLDELLAKNVPIRRIEHKESSARQVVDDTEAAARADLFEAAQGDGNWNLALEVAMAGLPNAEKMSGDPERLRLLEAIPIHSLEGPRKFSCCLALARHTMYAGREEDARGWSEMARSLASSPAEKLLAYITTAIVGDWPDERTPIPLPPDFESGHDQTVSLQSLQVAVMSHLERASFEGSAPLYRRYVALVELSNEPYRRWHALLLESMHHFVAGEIDTAVAAAHQARKYAQVFGIVDAEVFLVGQLSNARLIHPAFAGIDNYQLEFSGSSNMTLSRALQAVQRAPVDGGAAVDAFLATYNYRSRSFFTFATVAIVAPYVRTPELRASIAARLKVRTGTSAIWGSGAVHLGPVDRILARLVDDPVDREMHLAAAVHVADRQQMRLWQVVCRLDLAQESGNSEHRRQAESLASTPGLRTLVADYTWQPPR